MKKRFASIPTDSLFLAIAAISASSTMFTIAQAAPAPGAPSVDEILKKSVQSIYSGSEDSVYTMNLGEGTPRKMRVLYKRGGNQSAKLLIKFQEPADIRGTGLLSVLEQGKSADQWLYVPALKKTRRIKGGNESESFLGSEFTIGDLTSADNDTQRYDYQLTSQDESCGGGKCYTITASPKSGVDASSLPYSKKILHVRKDSFVTEKIEFFNAEGKLEKILSMQSIHAAGANGFLADKMEMKNLLTGHTTVIEATKRDTAKTPADSAFTQNSLEKS